MITLKFDGSLLKFRESKDALKFLSLQYMSNGTVIDVKTPRVAQEVILP